jgi:hypothetical protein
MDRLSLKNIVFVGLMGWAFTLALRKFVLPAVHGFLPEAVQELIEEGL